MTTNNKIKFIGTILGIVLFISLIAGITYAWITWTSENINISGTSECFTVNYTKGQTINNASVILFDESKIINNNKITIKNGMAITNVTAGLNSNCSISGNITISLTINNLNTAYISGNSIGAFKYALASYDPSVYTTITTSALSNTAFDIIKTESITSTDKITLVAEELSTTTKGYLIIFYVDGNLVDNDAKDSTFSATIDAVAAQTAE